MPPTDLIEVLITGDTTGSMFPCAGQMRRLIDVSTRRLFRDVPRIRIGYIFHGDYCDARTTYVTRQHPLSSNVESLCHFVHSVGPTHGGDAPECYELVLDEARTMGWTAGSKKRLVMIGDATPHSPHERQNTRKLDWRNGVKLFREMGGVVDAVQALNRREATPFWRELAELGGGNHFELGQFSTVTDLIIVICFEQAGTDVLMRYEEEVVAAGRMDRTLYQSFTRLGRHARRIRSEYTKAVAGLEPVPPGRFQMLRVNEEIKMKDFVIREDLIFQPKKGFYEFTKRELIREPVEVVLVDNVTGDMLTGATARYMIGVPPGVRGSASPKDIPGYTAFIQSQSHTRVLRANTRFLYEVDMSR
jgi:hypothetical protein